MENNRQSTLDDSKSIESLLNVIREKHGDAVLAIVVYGSWLRGNRDTMLDFYVLVKDYRSLDSGWQGLMCRLLPPNVYQIRSKIEDTRENETDSDGLELRAKYALMTLDQFCHTMQHDFHSYFWARFAQPCEILFVRDKKTAAALSKSFKSASETFIRYVLPVMPDHFSSRDLWTMGLSHTYRCELRTESGNRADSLYDYNPDYYDAVTSSLALKGSGFNISAQDGAYRNHSSAAARKFSSVSWWLRRVQGKFLSVLRLVKAAFTFNDPLQYVLWKIERHTGIYIEPSERQLRHPLIFAWPLLWRLYKQGAFK
jgi:hypothetical protein